MVGRPTGSVLTLAWPFRPTEQTFDFAVTPGITHAGKKNPGSVRARYFKTGPEFRDWLTRHGSDERELLLGFYKYGSGRPVIAYPQALDEALCFGWIDGVRRRVDKSSYTIRFTPRRPRS